MKRERDFYRARGLPCPKDAALAGDKPGGGDEQEQPDNTDCHRKDEQVGYIILVFIIFEIKIMCYLISYSFITLINL